MGIYASMQVQVDDEGGAYGTNLTKGDVLVCAIRPGDANSCSCPMMGASRTGTRPSSLVTKNFSLDPSVFYMLSQKGDDHSESVLLVIRVNRNIHFFVVSRLLAQPLLRIPPTSYLGDHIAAPHVTIQPRGLRELH